jgi:hypothetical protein
MRRRWIAKGIIGLLLAAAVLVAVTYIVMSLWNWLVPAVIGWKTIDFMQAMGLLVLTRLLVGFRGFGGWHRHHHGHWRGRMQERWANMTPEEREKFKEGMRGRCGWHHGHPRGGDGANSTGAM